MTLLTEISGPIAIINLHGKRISPNPCYKSSRQPTYLRSPRAFIPLTSLPKQLLLQCQQLSSGLGTHMLPFGDGRQIANHLNPSQLKLLQGKDVVGLEAIAQLM